MGTASAVCAPSPHGPPDMDPASDVRSAHTSACAVRATRATGHMPPPGAASDMSTISGLAFESGVTPALAHSRARRPSASSRYSRKKGRSFSCVSSVAARLRQAASAVRAVAASASSPSIRRRRSPSTRAVVSTNVASMPMGSPVSSRIALQEKVKYASSKYPLRSTTRIRSSIQIGLAPDITFWNIGSRRVSRISSQHGLVRRPSAAWDDVAPSTDRHASLYSCVPSRPHAMRVGKPEASMMPTAARRLGGQAAACAGACDQSNGRNATASGPPPAGESSPLTGIEGNSIVPGGNSDATAAVSTSAGSAPCRPSLGSAGPRASSVGSP